MSPGRPQNTLLPRTARGGEAGGLRGGRRRGRGGAGGRGSARGAAAAQRRLLMGGSADGERVRECSLPRPRLTPLVVRPRSTGPRARAKKKMRGALAASTALLRSALASALTSASTVGTAAWASASTGPAVAAGGSASAAATAAAARRTYIRVPVIRNQVSGAGWYGVVAAAAWHVRSKGRARVLCCCAAVDRP